jgi:hypothetical protein
MLCLASFDSFVGYGMSYWNQDKNASRGFGHDAQNPDLSYSYNPASFHDNIELSWAFCRIITNLAEYCY